jgi:DNA-binding response OmpR family regulator
LLTRGDEYGGDPEDLEIFISRLRAKLERPGDPSLIETVRAGGFRFRGAIR